METRYTDVLVVGGGLAGLRAAIGARRRGLEVITLSLVPAKRSHSAAAQGGMQASLGNSAGVGATTKRAFRRHGARQRLGSGPAGRAHVRRDGAEGNPRAGRLGRALESCAARRARGRHQRRARHHHGGRCAHGLITARNFGGTAQWRTSSSPTAPATPCSTPCRQPGHRRVHPGARAHGGDGPDLRRGRCCGVVARNLMTGELVGLRGRATCDRDRRFRPDLPCVDQRRDQRGHGGRDRARDRRGGARQHGGGAVPPDRDLSRRHPGHRGLPRRRRAAAGRRRPPLHAGLRAREEGAGLARRGVAAYGGAHRRRGKGARNRFGEHLWLDIRLLGESTSITAARGQGDLPVLPRHRSGARLIPVRPAQHYSMGGIRTDHRGETRRPARAVRRAARRRAGTCTASTASVATRWPRPSSPA
jgi:fumarate reductase flavoprotein subunit